MTRGPLAVLVVEHGDDGPPGRVGESLVQAGCALDVRRPYAGDTLPSTLADHDAVVVLGGAMDAGADADHPWLTSTKALVREAARDGVPALGICLGHQLCAVALGGVVGRNPRGQQIGLLDVGWRDGIVDDPLLAALAAARQGVHWNDDVVLDLPVGATVLATAPAGEPQAVRYAPSVWGLQLHPEVDEHAIEPWAAMDRDRYDQAFLEATLAEVAAAHDRLAADWHPLGAALAGLARARRDRP